MKNYTLYLVISSILLLLCFTMYYSKTIEGIGRGGGGRGATSGAHGGGGGGHSGGGGHACSIM